MPGLPFIPSHALHRAARWLGVTVLLVAITVPGLVQAAQLSSKSAAEQFFGSGNLPTSQYYLNPETPTAATNWQQISITVCRDKVSDCSPATSATDKQTFKLSKAVHYNRGQGADSWDYVFLPSGGNTDELSLIYRFNPGQQPHWGIVWGDPGSDITLDNQIVGLSGLSGTALGSVLGDRANEADTKSWGIPLSTNQSSLVSRSTNDPFAMAVNKVSELVGSLNQAVVSALNWAMNVGNLDDNAGLVNGWKVVRDLVNVLFIVILVAMAMLTIMRIEPQRYNVRSLLPLLVFAVISVNFSLVLASVMTNTATIVAQPLLASAQAVVGMGASMQADIGNSVQQNFGQAVVLLFAAVIMLIALLVLLIFFIIRILMVWILAALSPIIFLFMVLPLTRGEASKLLGQWIKWVYMVPVAFLVLYIGRAMLLPVVDNPAVDDPGANAILRAVFYAGVVIASVVIAMGLGGGLLRAVGKQTMRGGKLGGKGGLGLAGSIPLGRGMTVGEFGRAGQQFFKQRRNAQEQRGAERAAALGGRIHEVLGDRGLATSLTGRDRTQAEAVTEALVDDEMKKMDQIGFQRMDAQRVVDYDMANQATRDQMRASGLINAEQLAFAQSTIGRRAAAKRLAREGFWDWNIARAYGHTGYQSLMEGDPLMQNLRRQRYRPGHQFNRDDFNRLDLAITMSSLDGDGMRKLYPTTFQYADPNSQASQANPAASGLFQELLSDRGLEGIRMNATSVRQNVDTNHRNVASPRKRANELAMYRFAGREMQMNIIAGNLAGKEWVAIPGGPQTRTDGVTRMNQLRRQMQLDGKRHDE